MTIDNQMYIVLLKSKNDGKHIDGIEQNFTRILVIFFPYFDLVYNFTRIRFYISVYIRQTEYVEHVIINMEYHRPKL